MSFSTQFGPQPSKFIRKLDIQTQDRIKNKILKLQDDPFPPETERVEGYKDEKIFRVRVGEYRILYVVRYADKSIFIAKVDKRGRVYD